MPEPSDYLSELQTALADLGLDAVLIGAMAALRYRRVPRATTDIDFLVRTLGDLVNTMREAGYDVRTMSEPGEEPYAVFLRGHGRKIDVLRAETAYQHLAIDRAVDGVLSAEDVIIHKLIAWRARDRDDITEILATGRTLDHTYIERWATEWEVVDRWAEAQRRIEG